MSVAKYKLANATQKYTDLQSRIDSARIELDIARAAFKYRLVVLHPAEMPKGARKPNVPVLALGGFFASLVIAIVAAVVADLATGRFIETSQVSRGLSIPLLGEVDPP